MDCFASASDLANLAATPKTSRIEPKSFDQRISGRKKHVSACMLPPEEIAFAQGHWLIAHCTWVLVGRNLAPRKRGQRIV
jgi:hypothetical protein